MTENKHQNYKIKFCQAQLICGSLGAHCTLHTYQKIRSLLQGCYIPDYTGKTVKNDKRQCGVGKRRKGMEASKQKESADYSFGMSTIFHLIKHEKFLFFLGYFSCSPFLPQPHPLQVHNLPHVHSDQLQWGSPQSKVLVNMSTVGRI